MAGVITNEETKEYRKGQLLVYAQAGGAAIIGFNEDGKWTGGASTSDLPERFFNACIQAGNEVTNYQIILPDWQVGHEIDNWSEYVEV